MKKIIITILFTWLALLGHTQGPSLEWAKQMGGSDSYSITTDANGNVYTTGYFEGIADFDPGPDVQNLTSAGNFDIFIQKLDADGNLLWAKQIGGSDWDIGYSIATDTNGDVCIIGSFRGTVDFDPGPGVQNLTSAGYDDIFIQKLDTNGDFLWVKRIGGSGFDSGTSISTDINDDIYITGYFEGTVDFDPGTGISTLSSAGDFDIFIQKFGTNGNFLWLKRIGGNNYDQGNSITTDANGNVYTIGCFQGTVNLNPGSNPQIVTSAGSFDTFIHKLDANGTFLWAKRFGGSDYDWGNSITTDANGNVYSTGHFGATADFDPGTGVQNFTASGYSDIFIQKLDANGNFLWAKQMGGNDFASGNSVITDATGNIYTTGYFQGTVDFNMGANPENLTSAGGRDMYIQKLDTNGDFFWVKQTGGSSSDLGNSITTDASGHLYSTGHFGATVDFDPGTGVENLTSTGNRNTYIQKLNQTAVGLVENSLVEKFVLFPNPTNGSYAIKFDDIQGNLTIRLLSVLGVLIESKNFRDTNLIQLEIKHPTGIYMLEILDTNGNKATLKLLKR